MGKTRKTAAATGKVSTIVNIAEVGSTLGAGTLPHFTAKQWEQMTSDIPSGKSVPKFGVALEYYPIPDGAVLAQPICVQNPCEICRVPPPVPRRCAASASSRRVACSDSRASGRVVHVRAGCQ